MRTVVLGGYGNFGARICRALAQSPDIDVCVAGRNAVRAERLATQLGVRWSVIDIDSPQLPDALGRGGFDLVIHAAGPFQRQDYRVARAAAAAGSHYVDLADGRRFVCDFASPALDDAFRRARRVAVSGASSVPGLSSAVVAAHAARFARLDRVDLCIAPAQQAPRGAATLAAVLDYCGEPIQVLQAGQWTTVRGWSGLEPVAFARLPGRQGAWCDVPDLELLPRLWPQLQSVSFRAALEVGATQRALALLAALRGARLLPRPALLARLIARVASRFDALGSGNGGMVVRMAGLDRQGRALALAWHVTAPDSHGPQIPCMAAIALARQLAGRRGPPAGAHACLALVPLSQFEPQFAQWGMTCDLVLEQGQLDAHDDAREEAAA